MELKLYEEFSLNLSLNQLRMVSHLCCQECLGQTCSHRGKAGLKIITEHVFPSPRGSIGPQSDKIYPKSISYGDMEQCHFRGFEKLWRMCCGSVLW